MEPTKEAINHFDRTDSKPPNEMVLIDKIQFIRTKNNQHWMDILRIAVLWAPEGTKKIMADIAKNDAEITELTREIAG